MTSHALVPEIDSSEDTAIQPVDTSALAVSERAAIDAQVATARAFPRSITKSLREAGEMVSLDEDTAGSMFYSLPRGGKRLVGPSVRLAEVLSYAWGNLRVTSEVVGEESRFVIAEAICHDLEKNVAVKVRVKRRITDKHGRRFNDDMIGVTGNAAVSIAMRNAVFRVIPNTYVQRLFTEAQRVSLGGGTMAEKRAKALDWFERQGVKPQQVFDALAIEGIDDLSEKLLIELRGFVTSMRDGQLTMEQFLKQQDPDAQSDGANELNDAVKSKAAKADDKEPAKKKAAKGEAKKEPLQLGDVARLMKHATNHEQLTAAEKSGEHLDQKEIDLLASFATRCANLIDGEDPNASMNGTEQTNADFVAKQIKD